MHCEHWESGVCRSCTLIEVPYQEQLADKARSLRATLDTVPNASNIHWLPPASSEPRAFRTSAKLVVGGTRRRPTLGALGADRRGVDLPACQIQHPAINKAIPGLKRFIRALDLTPYDVPRRSGELKYILLTVGTDEQLMCRFVLRTRERVTDLRRSLPLLRELVHGVSVVTANIHPTHEAIVEGPEEIILTKARVLPLIVGDARLALGPRSFVQTNTQVASQLYRQAAKWASAPIAKAAPSTAWDLYCGVGGFALHLAQEGIASVAGVEVSDQAISSAITAARSMGISRSKAVFVTADATEWAKAQPAQTHPDVLVVNPPRRGIGEELARWIEESGIRRVIYSSCNPKSLVKDLALMPSYQGIEARLFDMFPHTDHAELALVLEKTRTLP